MRLAMMTAALAALALLCGTAAEARPFTVDDLLHEQSFGRTAVDPSGRWAVIERRDPYDSLGRYDAYLQTPTALTRLLVVDLRRPALGARPLRAGAGGRGVTLGAFSPSGAQLAVYRFANHRWTLGVVTLATRTVRWLPITPEKPAFGQVLQWLSEDSFLVIARPDHSLPWTLREGHVAADTLPPLWAASAEGTGAHTVVGSGRYRDLRPRATPRVLLRVDARTGRSVRLAQGALIDLELSPDHRQVALFETGVDIQPRADGPVQGEAGTATQATTLSILTLATGRRVIPCAACDALPHLLAWSPSGRALLTFMRDPGQTWPQGRLTRIDAAGRPETVGQGLTPGLRYRPEILSAGWMGEDPIVLGRAGSDGRADWYRLGAAGPVRLTGALASAPRTLQSLDAAGLTGVVGADLWRVGRMGAATRLAAGPVQAVRAPSTSPDGRLASAPPAGSWVSAAGQLAWVDATGLHSAGATPAAPGRIVAASRWTGAALVQDGDPTGRETLTLVSRDGRRTPLVSLNAQLAAVAAPRLRAVRHPGPEGQSLTSWLFLPPERPAGAPPPALVIEPYAGASWPSAPWDIPGSQRGFMLNVRALVGHGYAVLVPSLPSPMAAAGPMADLGPRLAAIVAAAAADPTLNGAFDPSRVALWGYSFGGYTVDAAIGQTDRFRAAIAIAGPSDFISQWETVPALHRSVPEEGPMYNWSSGAVETGQEEMGAPPWRDPQRYLANSPIMAADRIHTPLLLIHGEQDAVPLTQSEAMFSALYRQDKDAILVTYWGEGHAFTSPGNIRDLFARAFAFLDAHLTPAGGAATLASPGPGPASDAPTPRRSPPRGCSPGGTPR
jgi:dipeptidyl aminopeptidase/acylaminoacyl peptidase